MGTYISTSRNNPCPVCAKTNGNCRTINGSPVVLCMTGLDGNLSDSLWHYTKNDKSGNWGMYVPRTEKVTISQERLQKVKEEQEAKEKARLERLKASLSNQERDTNYRLVHKYTGLTRLHRKALQERGLTDEQIDNGMFFSVNGINELPTSVSLRFPGIYPKNKTTNTIGYTFSNAIACPAWDIDGNIVGYQLRNMNPNAEAKYIWASTKEKGEVIVSSHLQNGELPLTYHQGGGQDSVFLEEGILKPYAAHCLHGIDVVGAAGGNFANSPQQLKQILENYNNIIYCPDAGAVTNSNVFNQIKKTYELIKSFGKEMQIAWWNQEDKQLDYDIDELDEFNPLIISFEVFSQIAEKAIYKQQKIAKLEGYTTFTADITFNSRYVADEFNKLDLDGKVTGGKAPKNTGKSFYLKNKVKKDNGRYVLIGNRVTLTSELAKSLPGFTFVDKSVYPDTIEEIWLSNREIEKRFAIVLDSLLKLKDLDWSGVTVIIDEAEQFLDSLLLGDTHIKKVRGAVLALLFEKLKQVKSIVLLDADLSDFTCNYFAQISGLPLQKIENTFIENKRNLFLYEKKEDLIDKLDTSIESGERNMVVGDSSTELTAIHDIYSKKGIKCLLLTKENLGDNPHLSEYLDNKGKKIVDDKIQLVLASPVIQSGISIEIGDYFDNNFALFTGVVPTNVARQMLVRDRGASPRHVWATAHGITYQNEFDPVAIQESNQFKDKMLLDAVHYYQEVEKLNFEDALEKVTELMRQGRDCKQLNFVTLSNLIAKTNIQFSDYVTVLRKELVKEGYNLEVIGDLSTSSEIPDLIKEQKELNLVNFAIKANQARELTEAQAEILSQRDNLTSEDSAALTKYFFTQKLPGVSPTADNILEVALKDRYKLINAIENYVYCLFPEKAKEQDLNRINYLLSLTRQGGIFWTYDSKSRSTLVDLFNFLDLQTIIDDGDITPELVEDLFKKMNNRRRTLKLFGIKWNKDSYKIPIIKKLLNIFGFTVKVTGKQNGLKTYGVCPIGDETNWQIFFESIKQKINTKIEVKYTAVCDIYEEGVQTFGNIKVKDRDKNVEDNYDLSHFVPDSKPYYEGNRVESLIHELGTQEKYKITSENNDKKALFSLGEMIEWEGKLYEIIDICHRGITFIPSFTDIKIPNFLTYDELQIDY